MNGVTCIVVDDDPMSRKLLENLISKTEGLQCKAYCESAMEAANLLQRDSVDLIFLDVEMPEMTGLDLLKALKVKPYVILVTSKEHYALPAFGLDVTDYVLKPVDMARFLKAYNKVLERLQGTREASPQDGKLFVKADSQLIGLEIDKIVMVEAMADYVRIYYNDKRYTVYSSMKGIAAKLLEPKFMRVHRSYIVNVSKIEKVDGNSIIVGGNLVPVGVTYLKPLMDSLNLL